MITADKCSDPHQSTRSEGKVLPRFLSNRLTRYPTSDIKARLPVRVVSPGEIINIDFGACSLDVSGPKFLRVRRCGTVMSK